MHEFIKRYEVWIFLWLIVVAQTVFVSAISFGYLPDGLYRLGRIFLLAGVMLLVVAVARGPARWFDLIRAMFNWKVPVYWYVIAPLWAPVLAMISVVVVGFATGKGFVSPLPDLDLISRPGVFLNVLFVAFVGEIVWISYATGLVAKRYAPFLASQIVGFFWTLWWVPINVIQIGVIPGIPLYALLISMLAVAATCSFFYYATKSGLIVLMLQFMFNASLLMFPVLPGNGGVAIFLFYSVVYWVAAYTMYRIFGPTPLFERKPEAAAA